MKGAVLPLLGLVILASCASISREECLQGDWTAIGLRDGAAGERPDMQFERHQRQCAKVDVAPERSAWQRGYDQGLRQFCTPLSGLAEGQRGRINRNLCPAAQAAGFDEGHALGLREHAQRMRVQNLLNEINSLRDRSNVIVGALAADSDTGLRAEWQNNRSEILHLQLELGLERAALRRLEREVAAFRARVGG
ncbi:DUF2799 domain-containing protein [Roseinatronobacter alkalisoli]|uniref:DUF2799 domain-containing protein n=1 Tax=Roseinatronobacter alkalisoli TaxID=3028235 RepID=A0ABT5T608_9RHOB|nr:DUF2799 domain-containing protein [Roseinatronobacter sp. HJB301]MDD7970545.1 DUF2799 domain-containing protein [Roseinatronobacter sp. HJB301]